MTGDNKAAGSAAGSVDHDPHPANEERYDRIPRPGGAPHKEGKDIGTNNAVHNGKAPPRPRNAENS